VRSSGIPFHYLPKSGNPPVNIPQLSKPSGEFLEKYLQGVGYTLSPYSRPEYRLTYTTDIVKCYLGRKPDGNGDNQPRKEETDNCKEWLLKEMALIEFRILLLLGAAATKTCFQIFEKGTIKRACEYYCKEVSFRYGNSDIPVYVLPLPVATVPSKSGIYDRTFRMVKEKLQSFRA
jgi:uracil-DNA glycosylase family 4